MENEAKLEMKEQREELLEEQLEEHLDKDDNVKTTMRVTKIQQKQKDEVNSVKITLLKPFTRSPGRMNEGGQGQCTLLSIEEELGSQATFRVLQRIEGPTHCFDHSRSLIVRAWS